MELIRKINTVHNTIFVYVFPVEHSSQAIAEWVITLLDKTNNRNEWINLENTTDSSDDGRDSIALQYEEGVLAIVNELKSRRIDSVITHINALGCRVSVSINIRSYILSIGLDKKDEDKIQQIEEFMDIQKEKKILHTISEQSISLAKEALGEHLTTGKVTVICPKCKENPRVWMTSKGERTYIECKCRYIHMGEINL